MNDNVKYRLSDVLLEAMGGDYLWAEQIASAEDTQYATMLFWRAVEQERLPHADILSEDYDLVLGGGEARYFLPMMRCGDLYRQRRGIWPGEDTGVYHGEELASILIKQNARVFAEMDRHDATLEPYRDGLACPHEQQAFYDSAEWADRAKVVRFLDRYRCRRCRATGTMLHAHHNQPIYSAYSRLFYRNFDTGRMITLCERCHRLWHKDMVKHAHGFESVTDAEKREYYDRQRRMDQLHDEARECLWCLHHVWRKQTMMP